MFVWCVNREGSSETAQMHLAQFACRSSNVIFNKHAQIFEIFFLITNEKEKFRKNLDCA